MILDHPFPTLTGAGARRLLGSKDRVVVVGAGGWLGLATLEALHQLLGADFEGRVVACGSNARDLSLRGGLVVRQSPLSELANMPPAPTLVLHFAFLTQEKAKTMSEADYIAANRGISAQVLDALDPIGATGVFVASSGAVYMAEDPNAEASKRLYGRLKREDEDTFLDWARARGRKAAIGRIFNLSGPYIRTDGAYALASFIADALCGGPIKVEARRPVIRSYVAIHDLMSVVCGILTDAADSPIVFDTAGRETLEMLAIAEVVRTVVDRSADVRAWTDRSGPPDRYVGDGMLYHSLLQMHGVAGLDFAAQVRDTADFLKWAKQQGRAGR